MKKKKITGITLLCAGALLSAAFGTAMPNGGIEASAETEKFALSDIFVTKNANIQAKTQGDDAVGVTAFQIFNGGSVNFNRDLAYQWYSGKGAQEGLSISFALQKGFESVTMSFDTTPAWATEDDKATNLITFTEVANSDKTTVKVNDQQEKEISTPTAETKLTLQATANDGEFLVKLDETEIGSFENVGANWAEYEYNKISPFKIYTNGTTSESATVLLYEINGQAFDNIDAELKVTDTAAPVFVVNEEVNGFLLGTAFALDYQAIDVLQDGKLTTSLKYYQYNPTDTEQTYKNLNTAVYFFETVYEKDNKQTSVFKEDGEEYISVKVNVSDSTFKDETKAEYDLSWYANRVVTKAEKDYLVIDRNTDGAYYKTEKDDVNYQNNKTDFENKLKEIASETYAGNNSKIELPSFAWLIDDNNGYRNLKFTISYRTPGSSNATTSSTTNLAYNSLKIPVEKEGNYEFKIFANDKAGNEMKRYLDGELVSVTASNVWDIDEIPTFSFEIANKGLYVKEKAGASANDRMETEVLDKKFVLDGFDVVGATDLQKEYALYKIDFSKNSKLKVSALTEISYSQLAEAVKAKGLASVEEGNYFNFYLDVYAEEIAKNVESTKEDVKACFIRIYEPDDRVNGKENDGVYEWNASSGTFKTIEEGNFLILGDFWEDATAKTTRATAYKLVTVETKAASIKGETDWLKNNVASVVLFSIAGVMLILIVILLLVKPSDEKLEDIDEKAPKKAKDKPKKEDE